MSTTATITEEEFLKRIQAGEKIEPNDPMPDEYRQNLLNLLEMQADSELSGAYGYIPWIEKAPTVHEKLLVAQIVKDEIRHAYAIYKCLEELGVDIDKRIKEQDFAYRLGEDNTNIGTQRAAKDKRVNIFYYPIETWTDFILFNFCMDRGAGHQLEDAMDSSYGPWQRAIKTIFKEEMMHVNHGDVWVERLANDSETRQDTQERLIKWYNRTMNIFGRPGSTRNKVYQKWGLKKRDNDEVREAYRKEIEEKVKAVGLDMPEWVPDYDENV
jgi:ring-1,2-phenylacetyl-CoA epoxidase subunit PaaA